MGVMSEEREIALGQSYDPQVVAQFGLYDNAQLQSYINNKGQQMAKISHRPHLDYTFRIVDSPVINAFAVPGGYVYFTRGIMAHFNNEAEFAGVLGHEIGHITARHSVVQQRNATLAQVGLIAGMIASPEIAQMAMQTQSLQLLLLKFGRDAESQSDELGVEYSSQIGYDAHEMADFFNTLARQSEAHGGGRIPEFQSTHPDPINRREKVNELAGEWQNAHGGKSLKVGRDTYLNMLQGLVYGEDPRQGYVENWNFYHPELKFYFPVPNGWRYQNSPQAFQMAPQDGKAAITLTAGQKEGSLAQMAQKFATDNGLTLTENTPGNTHGKATHTIVGVTTPTEQGQQAVKAKITYIDYNGLVYTIVAVTLAQDYPAYVGQFNNTLGNFKTLTDPAKINRMPETINVVTVNATKTLGQALQQYGIPADRMTEFSILNGMELTETVQGGAKIKVVNTASAGSNTGLKKNGGSTPTGNKAAGDSPAPRRGTLEKKTSTKKPATRNGTLEKKTDTKTPTTRTGLKKKTSTTKPTTTKKPTTRTGTLQKKDN